MTGLGPDSNFHTQRLWSTPLYRAPPQGVPVRTFTYLTAALLVVALIVTAIGVSTYRDDRDVEFSVSWSMDSEEFADTATRRCEPIAVAAERWMWRHPRSLPAG